MDISQTLMELIDLQTLDMEIDALQKMCREAQGEIDLISAKLKVFENQALVEKKVLDEKAKQRKVIEIEVLTMETKISKYQSQLYDVKNNKEYDALKVEIDRCQVDKGKLEEKVLEGMFQEDAQKVKLKALQEQIEKDRKTLQESTATLKAKIQDCEKSAAEKRTVRDRESANLDSEYREHYRTLRESGKTRAVAEVINDHTCGGCFLEIPPQQAIEVRRRDQIHRCTACGRFLFTKE